jgi:hypothetical protein
MRPSATKRRTALALTALAVGFPILAQVSPASAEPNPCAGRSGHDVGVGGDYYNGMSRNHQWSIRVIYGTWYNCGGNPGADRVKLVVSGDNDGPCITVPYGSTGSSVLTREYKLWPPHYDGWKRC